MPGCQPPAINETSLNKHRCHIETDLCIDQVRTDIQSTVSRVGLQASLCS